MWIAFVAFENLFTYDVLEYRYSTLVELDEKEPFCYSSIQCLLMFWSTGFFEGGTNELTGLLSYKERPGLFVAVFIYNFFAFIIINTIFSNVFTGLTTDAFGSFRDQSEHDEYDRENKCYICDFSRKMAATNAVDYNKHTNHHSITKYFEFLLYLFSKNVKEFTIQEKIVYDKILENDITWVPYKGEEEKDD